MDPICCVKMHISTRLGCFINKWLISGIILARITVELIIKVMIIQLKSDLHLESGSYTPVCKQGDVLVLAGDINRGIEGVLWALENYPGMEIVYVPGNHEFHGSNATIVSEQMRTLSDRTERLHILQRGSVMIGGIRFIGCTLWTDYKLLGKNTFIEACQQAEKSLSGARSIITGLNGSAREIEVSDVIDWHRMDVHFLERTLRQLYMGKTVVVSHYAPSKLLLPRHKRDLVKGCRDASDLEWLIRKYQPDYWFCGHTHCNSTVYINRTRVMSNQRGYAPSRLLADFQEDFLIDTQFSVHKSLRQKNSFSY